MSFFSGGRSVLMCNGHAGSRRHSFLSSLACGQVPHGLDLISSHRVIRDCFGVHASAAPIELNIATSLKPNQRVLIVLPFFGLPIQHFLWLA